MSLSKRQRSVDATALPDVLWVHIITFLDVYGWSRTMTQLQPPKWLRTATKVPDHP